MRGRKAERGYVLVSLGLLLLGLCAVAALALDMGVMQSARTSAQRAADAAALAGAFTFIVEPTAAQPATAQQHAMSTALSNNILDTMVTAPDVSVNVDVPNRRVTVDISVNRPTFFARAWGRNQVNIGARGIAEASPNSNGASCSKPWFIPNTVLSTQAPCDACAAGEVFISNGQVTAWAQSQLGFQFTIKPNNPQNALAPGQFFAIRMPDSQGGNDYRTNIGTCTPDLVYCAETYGVEPGNMIGPTIQGVNDLTGPNPDIYLDLGQYQTSGGVVSDTSRQLISTPVWDECNLAGFCPSNTLPDGGATVQIEVIGFALVFIEGVQGNDVIARLVGISACATGAGGGGGGSGGSGSGETGPFSIPLRLIRVP